MNKQNVVISFYRGDWCPYCRSELEQFQEAYDEIKSFDTEILSIAPQTPEKAKNLESRLSLNLPLLSDPDLKISNDYKLTWDIPPKLQDVYIKNFNLDIPELNANRTWQLPSPATFIIDKSGKIVNKFVDLNYAKRMPIEKIISTLRNITNEN